MKKMSMALTVISLLQVATPVMAQWTTSGNDIYNSNSGNVGIGTASPAYKFHVMGAGSFDNGGGTGNVLTLRTNNGYTNFYGDASSDLHISGRLHVDQALFPDGGLLFNTYGAGISLNSGPVSGVSSLTFNGSSSYIKLTHDYNAFSPSGNQGMIVMYSNRSSGVYPRAALQVYKNGDPAENPFLISAQGFGWINNSKTDEVVWIVKGASSQTADLQHWQNATGTVLAKINAEGNIGIGVTAPQGKLETPHIRLGSTGGNNPLIQGLFNGLILESVESGSVVQLRTNAGYAEVTGTTADGEIRLTTSANSQRLRLKASGNISVYDAQPLSFSTNNVERMRVEANGSVSIGAVTNPVVFDTYKLAVAGNIIAEKVRVKLQSNGWPDYVFEPAYKLPTLAETEQFIQQNRHLPGVPTAAAIEKEGLDLGDSQALMLQKIEELTLHVIELHKRMEKLEKENNILKKNRKPE